MNNKKFTSLTCLLVVVGLFLSLFNVSICEAASNDVFSLVSDSKSAYVDSNYTIKIHGENIQDIYGFEAVIAFEPDKAEFIEAESKSLYQGFSVTPKIDNNKIIIPFTLIGKATPISGNTDIYKMTFKAKSKGQASIVFKSITIVDSKQNSKEYTNINSTVSVEQTATTTITSTGQNIVVGGDKPTISVIPVLDSKGTATAELFAETLSEAKKHTKADDNGIKKVQVIISKVAGAKEYKLTVPVVAVSAVSFTDVLEIVSDVATLGLPNNMLLKDSVGSASKVTFSIAPTDSKNISAADKEKIGNKPVIELKMFANNKQIAWNNPDAPVTVSIDYKPTAEELKNPEHIVVWYIDGAGKIVPVPNGRYDEKTGKVVFKITHFSTYAVAYVQKTFSDISKYTWAKNEIEVMASKGVINGTSATTFTPAANITRADFMVLLVKSLGLSAKVDKNFTDVSSTAYYAEAVAIAKKLGMTAGVGENKFDPKANISRQDMMVLVYKALKIAGKPVASGSASELAAYKDAAKVSGYAADAVSALVKEGIIKGSADDMLNPKALLTRAEAAVVIYKVYNK